jgi:hypothetical protein
MSPNKQAETFPGREFYKTGGANWPQFIVWLILPFAAAALLAVGLFELFNLGHYYVVILPLIAAVLVALLVSLAINKGHCRSPIIGCTSGIAAGLVMYLGYFYCGMIYHVGPEVASRPDLLPLYIRARMESDVIRDVGADRENETRQRKGDPWFNWMTFAFEFIGVVAITGLAGHNRARKPYCRACGKWMQREVTQFEPNQATPILEALRTSSARSLAALCAQPVFATVPNATLAAEICPTLKDGVSRDCPVYVSLKQVTAAAHSPTRDSFDAPKGKLLLRSLKLNSDEFAALGSRFKVFETVAGRAAVAALQPETADSSGSSSTAALAEIKPVESDYAGKVLTRRNAFIALGYVLVALVLIFASIGLAAWGGMMAFPDKNSPQNVTPTKKILGIALLSAGGLCFLGTAVFFFVNPSFFSTRFLLRRAREEFSRRPKCLVDPNDPDALFIEIVPKLNWGRMMLETASDIGFLKVDPSRREILFEGDKERFRVPAEAITYAALEFFVEGQGSNAATKIYYVVLRANRSKDFWEVPLRERGGTGKFGARRRKKSAERLLLSIQQMRGLQGSTLEALGVRG